MRLTARLLSLSLLVAGGALPARPTRGDDAPVARPDRASAHGGCTHTTEGGVVYELVFEAEAVRVYVTDRDGRPIAAEGTTGKADIALVRANPAALRRGNHQGTSATLRWVAADPRSGRLRGSLVGGHPLGEAARQAVRLDVALSHAPPDGGGVAFRAELTGTTEVKRYGCTADGCPDDRAFDPGECPGCHGALVAVDEDGEPTEGARPARPRRPRR